MLRSLLKTRRPKATRFGFKAFVVASSWIGSVVLGSVYPDHGNVDQLPTAVLSLLIYANLSAHTVPGWRIKASQFGIAETTKEQQSKCRPRGQKSLTWFPHISDVLALPLNAAYTHQAPMQDSSSKQRWNDALHRKSLLSLPSIVGRTAQPRRGGSFEQGRWLEYAGLGEFVDLPRPCWTPSPEMHLANIPRPLHESHADTMHFPASVWRWFLPHHLGHWPHAAGVYPPVDPWHFRCPAHLPHAKRHSSAVDVQVHSRVYRPDFSQVAFQLLPSQGLPAPRRRRHVRHRWEAGCKTWVRPCHARSKNSFTHRNSQ